MSGYRAGKQTVDRRTRLQSSNHFIRGVQSVEELCSSADSPKKGIDNNVPFIKSFHEHLAQLVVFTVRTFNRTLRLRMIGRSNNMSNTEDEQKA